MKKGEKVRSYFLHPQTRVVDHRTGIETSDVRRVLDGDLDRFIEASLLHDVKHPPIKRKLG